MFKNGAKILMATLACSLWLLANPVMAEETTKLSGNAIYSWWTHPTATKVGSDLYFTGISSDGKWRVYKNSYRDEYFTLDDDGAGDDHNAPSILAQSGKDTLAFYTRHNTQDYVSYRRAPAGTLDFGPRRLLEFPNKTTYSQILSSGETIVILTRSGSGKWRYRISQDYGLTWAPVQDFITTTGHRIYLTFQQSETNPNIWHIAGARNPANPSRTYLVYGTLNLSGGDVSNSAGVIGNLYGTLNISEADLDDIQPVQNSDQRVRLLDVGDKHGKTVIYYAKWGGGITSRYYQAVQNPDSTWTRSSMGIYTGKDFHHGHSRHYIGGVALDRNNNNWLYVSSESNGTWTIKKHTIASDMTLTTPVTLASNTKPLVRPYAVRNSNSVIYCRLKKYDSYKSYLGELYKAAE